MNNRAWVIGLSLIVAIAIIAGGAAYFIGRDGWTKPEPAAEGAPTGLSKFYTQDVAWSGCGDAKCATIKVPVDDENADGETT